MTRILAYEPSFKRIEARLPDAAKDVEFVVVDDSGALKLNGREISIEEAAPDIGWMSVELFGAPASRNFFVALLKAPGLRSWLRGPRRSSDRRPSSTAASCRGRRSRAA